MSPLGSRLAAPYRLPGLSAGVPDAALERRSGPARRRPVAGIAALLMLLAPPLLDGAGQTVAFRADDGRTLSGLLVEADQRPAPAVVLVPMLGRPRDDWEAVAQRLAEAGITALAIDLRDRTIPLEPADLAAWHTDIGAAVSFLASRSEVRAASLGVAGASLGANLAAVAAAGDLRIRSVALVSPSLDYRGVRIEAPLRQLGERPALFLASLRDPYAARSVRELARRTEGVRETRWSEMPAHGTVLLARDPDLVPVLVDWFRRTLGVN